MRKLIAQGWSCFQKDGPGQWSSWCRQGQPELQQEKSGTDSKCGCKNQQTGELNTSAPTGIWKYTPGGHHLYVYVSTCVCVCASMHVHARDRGSSGWSLEAPPFQQPMIYSFKEHLTIDHKAFPCQALQRKATKLQWRKDRQSNWSRILRHLFSSLSNKSCSCPPEQIAMTWNLTMKNIYKFEVDIIILLKMFFLPVSEF